jgi:predicted O-methyltransferase YrrM
MNDINLPFTRFNVEFINPLTLCRYATSLDTWNEIMNFHSLLASDEYVLKLEDYYRKAIKKFGKNWWHLDIVNVLYAASRLHKPTNYLEIGVRRGRSCAVVARGNPLVNIYACDMWMKSYAGMENPGPDFVSKELILHGHKGEIKFLNGDSHIVIPEFLNSNPNLMFDLITVDGDHSEIGALEDLNNVIGRLAPGGILVFDDIAHPLHPYLLSIWREAISNYPNLLSHEYVESGYGIAFAVNCV